MPTSSWSVSSGARSLRFSRRMGRPVFASARRSVLAELLAHRPLVLAAGGGAVLRPENRQRMVDAGTVVWLRSDPRTIAERISSDATTASRRPDLTSQGGLQEIVALLAARTPLYESCADFQIETSAKTPLEVVDEIVQRWTGDRCD